MASDSAVCEHCGGRGWIIEPDGKAGRAHSCVCRERTFRERSELRCGVPPRYSNCTLELFHTVSEDPERQAALERAKREAERYLDAFVGAITSEPRRLPDIGLLFSGPPGVGKTHLAVSVLRALTRLGVRGLFVDFTALIHKIQSSFDSQSPDSKRKILRPVIESELLVLDELGAQKPTAWVSDLLYLVMNTRYTERRPTLFTTNYRLDEPLQEPSLDRGLDRGPSLSGGRLSLSSRIPASLLSRLFEMATSVEIEAGDFRREVKFADRRF